ncbi:MAG: coproporphyrinogen III oxidase [Salibacteraceae bacterium]|jgi:coproporphyrinogen III oxidase
MTKESIAKSFQDLQNRICQGLERVDGKSKFQEDLWTRADGGGGRTRTIGGDGIIEKGGVNFSEVHGKVTDMMKKNTEIDGDSFFASGVSIVIHPNSPHLPIIHMNVRYFELDNGKYWFGGGIDLTPHYIVPNQAKEFHAGLKAICDKYNINYYPKFKSWADDYFFLPHRDETRGVGGIFFDHLQDDQNTSKEQLLNYCIELGDAFSGLYEYQVNCGINEPVSERQLDWRNTRRGRYVEFNLVNDRGTKFGLVSGGRTESILMSLPPVANWEYCKEIEPNSQEQFTIDNLRKNINWVEK